MLPEAVAYAAIAGVAPRHAIFAAIAGGLTYAVLGRSRFAIIAPTSSSAAMLAATLGGLTDAPTERAALIVAVVGLVGLTFLAASLLRLGSLSAFIARPVLRGFAFGLAVTIIIKQVPTLLGIAAHGGSLPALVGALITALPSTNLWSATIGGSALAAVLILKQQTRVPAGLVILALAIGVSFIAALPLHHVAQVGPIETALTAPHLPPFTLALWSRIAQLALPLTLILFAESWGAMRTLALAHGDAVAADRELLALGGANLMAGLLNGMPVGAGFSASSANAAAGAQSRRAAAVGAGALGLLLFGANPLVARIPEPVLAAIVIAALTHALSPAPLRRLWLIKRDQWVGLLAALAVMGLGVLNGMIVAILLSLVALLRRLAVPRISELGQLADSHDFVDLAEHPEAHRLPNIAIFRPDAPLFFGNAERALSMIAAQVGDVSTLILSLEESDDFDSTALEALNEFATGLESRGVRLQLARLHDRVRGLLERAGPRILSDEAQFSVADAVARVRGG